MALSGGDFLIAAGECLENVSLAPSTLVRFDAQQYGRGSASPGDDERLVRPAESLEQLGGILRRSVTGMSSGFYAYVSGSKRTFKHSTRSS